MIKNDIEKLLQKEMDRKSFIKHVAIGFAALAGVTTVAKTLASMNASDKPQTLGYGSSAYGGGQNQQKTQPKA